MLSVAHIIFIEFNRIVGDTYVNLVKDVHCYLLTHVICFCVCIVLSVTYTITIKVHIFKMFELSFTLRCLYTNSVCEYLSDWFMHNVYASRLSIRCISFFWLKLRCWGCRWQSPMCLQWRWWCHILWWGGCQLEVVTGALFGYPLALDTRKGVTAAHFYPTLLVFPLSLLGPLTLFGFEGVRPLGRGRPTSPSLHHGETRTESIFSPNRRLQKQTSPTYRQSTWIWFVVDSLCNLCRKVS